MNLKAGYPFSLIKNGLVANYPKLEKDTRTNVVIMGGGISGALTAHRLMQKGIDCIIVDARSIGSAVLAQAHHYCNMKLTSPYTNWLH
ncbi:MAG: FAD-dependent monooxygenase [Bacteroidota bacterium]